MSGDRLVLTEVSDARCHSVRYESRWRLEGASLTLHDLEVENIVSGRLTERVQCHEDRGAGVPKAGLHSKYLLVEGVYDGKAGRKLVFTGSHNYTYPALRANDETLLKIDVEKGESLRGMSASLATILAVAGLAEG